jgi:hypothetical protein
MHADGFTLGLAAIRQARQKAEHPQLSEFYSLATKQLPEFSNSFFQNSAAPESCEGLKYLFFGNLAYPAVSRSDS